ncbi:MAG: hypothetical protein KBD76_05090 [Bacteriovorax sp.]|nr:hypothetical protein [Bacteriovorax sp.]
MKNLLKPQISNQLKKSKKHFNYSFNKIITYDLSKGLDSLNEEELESLESFVSRFARISDIVIQKYFRILAMEKDPAYQGSVVDLLNFAEKWNWIQSAADWIRIRELRNLIAHEYSMDDFVSLYEDLKTLTPVILAISDEL